MPKDIFAFQGKYSGVVFDPTAPQGFGGSIRVDILDNRIEVMYLPPNHMSNLLKQVISKGDVHPISIEDIQKELEEASDPSQTAPDCYQLGVYGKMLFWDKPDAGKGCMTVWPASDKCQAGILFGQSEAQQIIFEALRLELKKMLPYPFVQL